MHVWDLDAIMYDVCNGIILHTMLFICVHSNMNLRRQKYQIAKKISWNCLESWENITFHSANTNDLCHCRKLNRETKQHFVVNSLYCYNFRLAGMKRKLDEDH